MQPSKTLLQSHHASTSFGDHSPQPPKRNNQLSKQERIVGLGIFCGVSALQIAFQIPFNFWLSTTGILFFILGAAADIYATYITFVRFKGKFDERGLEFPYIEANESFSYFPTLREQILSVPTLRDILMLPIVAIAPGFGISLGLLSFNAAHDHWMGHKQLRVVLKHASRHSEFEAT